MFSKGGAHLGEQRHPRVKLRAAALERPRLPEVRVHVPANRVIIPQNVFINWFEKVNSPTKSSTYHLLLLITILR